MEKIAKSVLKRSKLVLAIFIVLAIISAYLFTRVKINFQITDYLPEDSDTMLDLAVFQEEFSDAIPNLDISVPKISLTEALVLKEKLAEIEEVKSIQWLDDVADLQEPLEMIPQAYQDMFYKDSEARFILSLDTDDYDLLIRKIEEILPEDSFKWGQAMTIALANRATSVEIRNIMIYAVPLALVIMILAGKSYFEPFIFLTTVLIALLLNSGTNVFLGEISFITQAVSAVLQMAVSLDYSIFLLNRFNQFREEGLDIEEAMQKAMVKSISSVGSSAATTFFGFLSLVFMRFLLGRDLGIVLSKGIVFSIVTTFFLLPVITCMSYKLIDKTTHQSFLFKDACSRKFAQAINKFSPIILVLVLISSFFFARTPAKVPFFYGLNVSPEGSEAYRNQQHLEKNFGASQMLLYLAPKGEPAKEVALLKDLEALDYVKEVVTYANQVGYELPPELLSKEQSEVFFSEKYSRFILYTDLRSEGERSFAAVKELKELAAKYYEPSSSHWLGESFSLEEMKRIITVDNNLVNVLTIVSVGIIILLVFRSFSMPILLLFTIEYAIWTNMAILLYSGVALSYTGYLVVSTIQLGATVDYGILMAENYLHARRELAKQEATIKTMTQTLPAILPPAFILGGVGYILRYLSSLPIVSDIGKVLGRGALLSLASVVLILPNLLAVLDPFIRYTSLRPDTAKIMGKDYLFTNSAERDDK